MKTSKKVAIVAVVLFAFILMAFIPVLAGPTFAVPDQKVSVTQAYLGFGAASSYNGKFYYVCGLSNIEALTHIPPC